MIVHVSDSENPIREKTSIARCWRAKYVRWSTERTQSTYFGIRKKLDALFFPLGRAEAGAGRDFHATAPRAMFRCSARLSATCANRALISGRSLAVTSWWTKSEYTAARGESSIIKATQVETFKLGITVHQYAPSAQQRPLTQSNTERLVRE